jgi:hypothetical protein
MLKFSKPKEERLAQCTVLAQPEMEKRRSPLVQIPPQRGGDFQGMRVYRPMNPFLVVSMQRGGQAPALLNIGSMSPPDYPSAWLHPCVRDSVKFRTFKRVKARRSVVVQGGTSTAARCGQPASEPGVPLTDSDGSSSLELSTSDITSVILRSAVRWDTVGRQIASLV